MSTKKRTYLKLIPLGGLGKATKNMHVYEQGNDIVIVDCGIAFPTEATPGVDLIIPDISPIKNKKQKIKGIVLSHGHQDHIGAIPYIVPQLNFPPIYGTRLTLGLVEASLEEFNLEKKPELIEIQPDKPIKLGNFQLDFFRVTHSIPDAVGLIINTPLGKIIHAADYKFDWTPAAGPPPDISKIAAAGEQGVHLLLSDCLGAEREGYTLSETLIEEVFSQHMRDAESRVFITTYSSNISRIQQAVNASKKNNRKVAFLGRSLNESVRVAQSLNYLNIPKGMYVKAHKIKDVPPKQLTIIVAGALGQPNSSLTRVASGEHRLAQIKKGDIVLFSADPIPGSEEHVTDVIDDLYIQGARVFYSRITDELHVSGHASQEELKLMLALTKPNFIVPIGGTVAMARRYSLLAQSMGHPAKNIFELEEGETLEMSKTFVRKGRKIGVQNILVDGLGVGDVGNVVLRDRQQLAKDGILVAVIPIEHKTNKVAGEIELISRGFVYVKEAGQLMNKAKKIVASSVAEEKKQKNLRYLRRKISDKLETFFYEETKRRPIVLVELIEV